MRKHIVQCWQSLSLVIIPAVIILVTSVSTFAQKGIGEKYNSRDPRLCSKAASPNAKPTIAEAVASVICNGEHEAGIETLYLYEDVVVTQIAKGTPYKRDIANATDIDLDFLIYPIRGSFKKYQCTLSTPTNEPIKSCNLSDNQNAEGRCFKNTFGQWRCSMSDSTVRDSIKAFPPGSAEAAKKAATENQTAKTQTGNQPAETKNAPDAAAEKDENGFVKPDFSEMEKYFEIVKTDYDFSLGRFNMLVKAKKKTNIFQWYMTFYDADGVKISDRSFNGNIGSPELGEPTKIYGYTPTEKEMKQVARIAITRKPD
jgi:hypothetical protein